ncbi:helix-turn-helix domain-containing protein, partial [Variovorax ginsengisoli]
RRGLLLMSSAPVIRALSSPMGAAYPLCGVFRFARPALIAELANEEVGGAQPPLAVAQVAIQDEWLTTAQAAAKLETSRVYISMLCNTGKLGEVVMIDGRHRRIRASAVQAYLESRTENHENRVSPRQAGVDARLYDYPDGHFVNALREEQRATKVARKTSRAKADRQSHR